MKTIAGSTLVLCATVYMASSAAAQTPVGALAIDERQGDQYGWAVDYETAASARQAALGACGSGCSVVLTFERCAAYAADQAAASTAVGWAESYASADRARQAALSECGSRGGSGCVVRVWGCTGPVVEEGLGLDRAGRREVQQGLQAAGFDPGGADGMFGPRTRSAIRSWQRSRGARATGYLDGRVGGGAAAVGSESAAVCAVCRLHGAAAASVGVEPGGPEVEVVFWQSIANSTNPVEFEAYLSQFPNGVFRALAEVRLAALRSPAAAAGRGSGGVGSPVSGSRVGGAPGAVSGVVAGGDAPRRPGDVFRDCAECPEMVVMAGGGLAMGRYEVTVGEYRAFVSAMAGGAGGGCTFAFDESWQNPGYPQTDRHPVTCVSWDDAQEYVSWLSRRTGASYRLPTETEWERARLGRTARTRLVCRTWCGMAKRCPVAGRRRAVAPMAGGVEAGDTMDDGGERRALVLLDETPIADVLEPPVGDVGRDLLHGVEAEVAAVGEDRGEQRAHLPGVDQLLPWLLEVDAEPEVVLDLDEQVGQPDRAAAGVQPAVQLGEAVRLRRIEVLGRVRLQPPPIVVERDLPVVSDTLQELVERVR